MVAYEKLQLDKEIIKQRIVCEIIIVSEHIIL